MVNRYFVVGGEYADTSFTSIATGHREERFGPFAEHEAHECWRALTGKTVDNAMIRYFIRSAEEAKGDQWYVIGGEYSDTDFECIANGRNLQIFGPYSRVDAMDQWRSLTGRTVDSALTRFDLCTAEELSIRNAVTAADKAPN